MAFVLSLPALPRLPGQDLVAAPLKWAAGKASEVPGWAASTLAEMAGVRRETWTYPGRVHLQLRCPVPEQLTDAVESALSVHPSVRWARVNLPLKRVIVAVEDPPPIDELVAILDKAEQAAAEKDPAITEGTPGGPPVALVLGADVLGLAATAVEWAVHRAPLPPGAARPWPGRPSPIPKRSPTPPPWRRPSSTLARAPGSGVVRLPSLVNAAAVLSTYFKERSTRTWGVLTQPRVPPRA